MRDLNRVRQRIVSCFLCDAAVAAPAPALAGIVVGVIGTVLLIIVAIICFVVIRSVPSLVMAIEGY